MELIEWLTALGIFATALVALIVAFIPSFRRWYNKPNLVIEFQNEEPFCRHAVLINDLNRVVHYWARLRIINLGKSVAKNCKVKLVRIRDAKTLEERKDFDPVVLRWVTGEGNPLDLGRTDREYVNILFTKENDSTHFFIDSIEKEPRAINLTPERKDYIFDIIVLGDNAEPIAKSFYIKNNKDYDKIELVTTNTLSNSKPNETRTEKHNQNLFPNLITKLLVVVFSLVLSFSVFLLLPPNGVPSANLYLTEKSAEIELQANNDCLIFLGTIFLTSLLGVLSLYQSFKQKFCKENILHSFLYFGLVSGIVFSLAEVIHVLRENFSIINSDLLGLKNWANQTTFFDFYRSIQYGWGTVLGLAISVIFTAIFGLLFVININLWADSSKK